MSAEHIRVLTALATYVAEHGTFPERERFRAKQAPQVAAFDELERLDELRPWDGRTLVVWTIKALTRIISDVQFAQKELDRARTVFDELVRMYGEHLGAEHTVAELNSRVCFTDDNQVRRALMLLRPSVFDDFSIWLGDVRERFQISGVILTLSPDTLFPTREPQGDGVAVRHGAFDPDHEARRLFFEGFATPYRERGDDVPRGPRPRKRRVPFEVLVRRGLLEEAASPGTFRLTDIGKEVSLTPAKFAEFWRRSDPVPQESSASDSSELPGLRNSSEESSAAGWNAALHQVIDHQDELGLLADALFVILRRARARDQSSSPGSMQDLEVGVLEKAVLASARKESSERAVAILNTVPGMEAVIELLWKAK